MKKRTIILIIVAVLVLIIALGVVRHWSFITNYFEIQRLWDEASLYPKDGRVCYFQYGEVTVIFSPSPRDTLILGDSYISAAGRSFSYPMPFKLVAYRDGEFYELQDAYKQGILTKEEIRKLQTDFKRRVDPDEIYPPTKYNPHQ